MLQVRVVYSSGVVLEFLTDKWEQQKGTAGLSSISWGNPPPGDFDAKYISIEGIVAIFTRQLPAPEVGGAPKDLPLAVGAEVCDRCGSQFPAHFVGATHRLAEYAEFRSDLEDLRLCPACFFTLTDAEYHQDLQTIAAFADLVVPNHQKGDSQL